MFIKAKKIIGGPTPNRMTKHGESLRKRLRKRQRQDDLPDPQWPRLTRSRPSVSEDSKGSDKGRRRKGVVDFVIKSCFICQTVRLWARGACYVPFINTTLPLSSPISFLVLRLGSPIQSSVITAILYNLLMLDQLSIYDNNLQSVLGVLTIVLIPVGIYSYGFFFSLQ